MATSSPRASAACPFSQLEWYRTAGREGGLERISQLGIQAAVRPGALHRCGPCMSGCMVGCKSPQVRSLALNSGTGGGLAHLLANQVTGLQQGAWAAQACQPRTERC